MEYPTANASSELKFDAALKKLTQAWKAKEKEQLTQKSLKLQALTQELLKLKSVQQEAKKRLGYLEEKKFQLTEQIKEVFIENCKLENLKSKLAESLQEEEIRSKSFSPKMKSVEDQGREFFSQAKARLSFENFSLFSSYVKQLNERTISKDEALEDIREIFQSENSDLFETFQLLLSRF